MRILAVNPWIYDFAAFDFWLKPYGFLVLLEYLRKKGFSIDFIDCLDAKTTIDDFGRGKYMSEIIPKPKALGSVPRYYKRYGITPQTFSQRVSACDPDLIFITSSMTYWYSALIDTVAILAKHFPNVPIVIGGTYASLCPEHASRLFPKTTIVRTKDLGQFLESIGVTMNEEEFYATLPRYESFYHHIDYIVLRSTWGCPFNCSYCSIKELSSRFVTLETSSITNFIMTYYGHGIRNFVLYDDAFLYDTANAKILLREIVDRKLSLRIHTPNALHIRYVDSEIAFLLKAAGFINPHFGLETLDDSLQAIWQDKVNREDFLRGINHLKAAGFREGSFYFYLLLGHPNQDLARLKNDVDFLHSLGAKVSLAEFSPTPKTVLFDAFKESLSEPLLHNNSTFPFFPNETLNRIFALKNYVRGLNKEYAVLK